jgi:predicted transcriptional regulator
LKVRFLRGSIPCLSTFDDFGFAGFLQSRTAWVARVGMEPAVSRIGYSGAMNANVSIEVDQHTADVLQTRAAELGVTVSELIAELAALDGAPRQADADEIAELDRRSGRAAAGSRVPHDRVVRWLRTWGTPRFRRWPGQ